MVIQPNTGFPARPCNANTTIETKLLSSHLPGAPHAVSVHVYNRAELWSLVQPAEDDVGPSSMWPWTPEEEDLKEEEDLEEEEDLDVAMDP